MQSDYDGREANDSDNDNDGVPSTPCIHTPDRITRAAAAAAACRLLT